MATAHSMGTPTRVDLPAARLAPASDAAYRADLLCRYLAAADWPVELALLAEATAYDKANPGAPSLSDELYAARLGDAA